jgi:uncharacterized protein YbdZ (MbtH family)
MFSKNISRNTIPLVCFKIFFVLISFCFATGIQAQNLACIEKDACFEFSYKGYVLNKDATVTLTFGIKVDCDYDLSHVAFELPNGITSVSPTNSNTAYLFSLANPTNNPFYSVKFNGRALNGFKRGVSDDFSYTIPAKEFNSSNRIRVQAKAGLLIGNVSFNPQGCCNSTTDINGASFVCSNSEQKFSVLPVAGVKSFVWALPAGWTITAGDSTNEITVKTTNKSGTIKVQQGISICGSKTLAMLQTVIQSPPVSISGGTMVCGNSYYDYEVPAVSGALYYAWQIPSDWKIVSSPVYFGFSNKITVLTGTSGGTVSAAAANICNISSPVSLSALIEPKVEIYKIEGDSTPCFGSIQTYKVYTNNATAFNWTVPENLTLISRQGTSTITVKINSGNPKEQIQVDVKSQYSCSSTSAKLRLHIKTAPHINSHPEPVAIYAGNQANYIVNASGSDLAYKWQVYNKTQWLDVVNTSLYSGANTYNLHITNAPEVLNGYKYRCIVSGSCAPADSSKAVFLNVVAPGPMVNVRTYMDGPYSTNTGFMSSALNSANYIPQMQPYSGAPWNYAGTECVPASFFPANPDVVDWVLIELRTGISATTIVSRKAGFIKKDGLLSDIVGQNLPAFSGVAPGSYFVVISHRSHLEIMSKTPVSINMANPTLFDFSLSYDKAYGISPLKKRTNNKWVMYSGDANSSGTITTIDWNIYWKSENGQSGYLQSDFDLDGIVTLSDLDNQWRPNNGKVTQVPR